MAKIQDNSPSNYTIIVPTDFSKPSKYGLNMALKISKRVPVKIHLVHWVVAPPDVLLKSSTEIAESESRQQDIFTLELIKKQKKKLLKWKRKYKEISDVSVSLKMDHMSSGIAKMADEVEADLIVMGTSGERALTEVFTGNHAEQVARKASCPVLTLRKSPRKLNFKDIIVGVDLTDRSKEIEKLENFASLFQSTVHLTYVDTSSLGQKSEAVMQLKLLAMKHRFPDYTLNYVSDPDEMSGLRHIAQIKQSGLIAVITEQNNFLVDLFSRDTAGKLIKSANRPVLTIGYE